MRRISRACSVWAAVLLCLVAADDDILHNLRERAQRASNEQLAGPAAPSSPQHPRPPPTVEVACPAEAHLQLLVRAVMEIADEAILGSQSHSELKNALRDINSGWPLPVSA